MVLRMLTAALVLIPVTASGAVRTFTDHDGNSIRAELTGVKDGQVVLNQAGTRRQYPLSSFTLADRDFIVRSLLDKKQEGLVQELMMFEVRNSNRSAPVGSQVIPSRRPDPGFGGPSPVGSASAPGTAAGSRPSEPKVRYGITIPTEELIVEPQPRNWTDLRGQAVVAAYVRIDDTATVLLQLRSGPVQRVPLVNLVREDIDFIREALEADQAVPIFPAGRFVTPSIDAQAAGVRTWTDRRGERLAAKFVRRDGRNTVLDVDGAEERYATIGLSSADRQWIDQEERRRGEELRRQQAAARQQVAVRQQAARGTGTAANSRPRDVFAPQPGGSSSQPIVPRTGLPRIGMRAEYEFRCPHCGHHWVRVDQEYDYCRKCAGENVSSTPDGSSIRKTRRRFGERGPALQTKEQAVLGLIGKLISIVLFGCAGLWMWNARQNR